MPSATYQAEWHARNPDKRREYNRRHRVKRFGLTVEDYLAMVEAQDGRCAICTVRPDEDLSIDHDHETGQVRGLLCRPCNLGLGGLGDNLDALKRVVAYLEEANGRLVL